MANIGQKIGLMLMNLGTKLANNFGSAATTYVPICDSPANNLAPKGAMSLTELQTVLGGMPLLNVVNYGDMTYNGLYERMPSVGISNSDIPIGWDGTYLYVAHFQFSGLGIDIATIYNHSRYWIGSNNSWREL